MSQMPHQPPFDGKDAADHFREGENAFGEDAVEKASNEMRQRMHEMGMAERRRNIEQRAHGENSSETDFLRYRIKNGEKVRYNISEHRGFLHLREESPYNSGTLHMNFIQGRQTGRWPTAADNIKLPKDAPLHEALQYTDEIAVDKFRKGTKEYNDYIAFKSKYGLVIKKAKLLQGRLKCRFRPLFNYQNEIISLLGNNSKEAEAIQKAMDEWALKGASKSSDIFAKGSQNDVVDAMQKAINAIQPKDKDEEEKLKSIKKKFDDVLGKIEEEMENRRKGRKLDTAALFQDISCNPDAVVFKQGQAFMVKDGDNFHMVGGREEDWEQLILAALKYINDKDPWSARPEFTGSPEFVTFAISVARKYTIRWAITDQSNGTGYEENFFQYGDQLQAIQAQSPQHHEQGFWVETVFVYQEQEDGSVKQLYEDSPTGKQIPRTMSVQCWDPDVANPTMKDIDWTHVRNFACRRPPYESGLVRKGYMDTHKRARQGVIMPFRKDADGVERIDSENLNGATLKIMSFADLKKSNETAFPNTRIDSISDLLAAHDPYSRAAQSEIFDPQQVMDHVHNIIGQSEMPEDVCRIIDASFVNYLQQGAGAPTTGQMIDMLVELPITPDLKKAFKDTVMKADSHLGSQKMQDTRRSAPGMDFAVA